MKNKDIFIVHKKSSELEFLEEIYTKVALGETVKFNNKAYKRIRPINNMYRKYPYHFICVQNDIHSGNVFTKDKWDDTVNISCRYNVIYETDSTENQLKTLFESEAISCSKGGLIEGLSRYEQLFRDIKIMQKCGFIDEKTEKEIHDMLEFHLQNDTIMVNGNKQKYR